MKNLFAKWKFNKLILIYKMEIFDNKIFEYLPNLKKIVIGIKSGEIQNIKLSKLAKRLKGKSLEKIFTSTDIKINEAICIFGGTPQYTPSYLNILNSDEKCECIEDYESYIFNFSYFPADGRIADEKKR